MDYARFPFKVHVILKRAENFRMPLNRPGGAQRSQTLISYIVCCQVLFYYSEFPFKIYTYQMFVY